MAKIKNVDLYRDGGSFEFTYKGNSYVCMTPLFLIENNKGELIDLALYKEITLSFEETLKSETDQYKKLMSGRFHDVKKALHIILRYKDEETKKEN